MLAILGFDGSRDPGDIGGRFQTSVDPAGITVLQ
jgi:hypothetical protein